jgi:sulfoxide reductase catalytic subunit YedY
VEPTSAAKFVEFATLHDAEQFPGQKKGVFGWGGLDWPYIEGCEWTRPCTRSPSLTLGMYGQVLPNQNGAPVRVIIPWKYGFKSGKSIVRIRLTSEQPKTAWEKAAPSEYGFYSNVNPTVDHPRWSQANRAAHRRVPPAEDAAVQRLRGPGRLALHGAGSEEVLLSGT